MQSGLSIPFAGKHRDDDGKTSKAVKKPSAQGGAGKSPNQRPLRLARRPQNGDAPYANARRANEAGRTGLRQGTGVFRPSGARPPRDTMVSFLDWSEEAVEAFRAIEQIRARAALDDPVADLGEAFGVREASQQPRQPFRRFSAELP